MSNVIAAPVSKKAILDFTNYFRQKLGMENWFYVPIVPLVEVSLCRIDDSYNFIVEEKDEMKTEYANYCPQTNTMTVREDVYLAACEGDGRHRFTLAHELGHYLFHGSETAFSRCNGNDIPIYCDPEWQANTFASFLLMPPNLIKGLDADTVMKRCMTSRQASTFALKYANRKR